MRRRIRLVEFQTENSSCVMPSEKLRRRNGYGATGELLALRHLLPNLDFCLYRIEISVRSDRVLALNFDPDIVFLDSECDRIANRQIRSRFLGTLRQISQIANLDHKAKAGACVGQFQQFRALIGIFISGKNRARESDQRNQD